MNGRVAQDRLTTHSHRLVKAISYMLIFVLALRRSNDLTGGFTFSLALLLLGVFTILYASESRISQRIRSYSRIYFTVQMIIVLSLGIFQEYQDTWSVLFIVLGFQVATRCSRKEAMVWFGLFITSLLIILSAEFGLISGIGRALAYIVVGVLLISYDSQYAQHEDALAESQMLVTELQEANRKLEEYSAHAEKLAAMQERNRMIQELYDSVGQKIFVIQLAAETTRLMLEKDPHRAAEQIDDLQEQTQSVLGQMRQLIGQWRPG
jgi:signal transduction histidine kinase